MRRFECYLETGFESKQEKNRRRESSACILSSKSNFQEVAEEVVFQKALKLISQIG